MEKTDIYLFIFLLVSALCTAIILVCARGWIKHFTEESTFHILKMKDFDRALHERQLKTYKDELDYMRKIMKDKNDQIFNRGNHIVALQSQIAELKQNNLSLTVQAATKTTRLNS